MSESTNSTPVFRKNIKTNSGIYKQYQQTVKPYVAQLGGNGRNEFPIEILNEVRAIMSHIAKCCKITNEELNSKEYRKTKSHMKRCVYWIAISITQCLAYSDYYENLRHISIALQI